MNFPAPSSGLYPDTNKYFLVLRLTADTAAHDKTLLCYPKKTQ